MAKFALSMVSVLGSLNEQHWLVAFSALHVKRSWVTIRSMATVAAAAILADGARRTAMRKGPAEGRADV